MAVDDHGLETIKKSGVDLKPNTAPKTDYALQSRAKPELFSFIRARSTAINSTAWTPLNLPVNTQRVIIANNDNKTIWITSDNAIAVGNTDGAFPIFAASAKEFFLKKDGSAVLYGSTGTGTSTVYVGGESNV